MSYEEKCYNCPQCPLHSQIPETKTGIAQLFHQDWLFLMWTVRTRLSNSFLISSCDVIISTLCSISNSDSDIRHLRGEHSTGVPCNDTQLARWLWCHYGHISSNEYTHYKHWYHITSRSFVSALLQRAVCSLVDPLHSSALMMEGQTKCCGASLII